MRKKINLKAVVLVCICQLWFCSSMMATHLYPRLRFLLNVLTVILPAANFYKSERVLWNGEQTTPSCPGLCVQIVYTHITLYPVCVSMCVSVCLRAGQQVWGTDGGSGPTVLMQELRIQPWNCVSGGKMLLLLTGAPAGG